MSYDPPTYWRKRGEGYLAEARRGKWHNQVNVPVFDLISPLAFDSVLEAGMGFGRVGAEILRRRPRTAYTGMDVSPDLVAAARTRLPASAELFVADLATWDPGDRTWDLVIAVSVLGHLLPGDILGVLDKLRQAARVAFLHVDWNEVGGETSFQYGHHYQRLWEELDAEIIEHRPYGRQDIWLVSPGTPT